jgi:D-3-phosphoglycerate dehydrogenase
MTEKTFPIEDAYAKRFNPVNKKHLRPFDTSDIKVLLLENISANAANALRKEGYQVEECKGALTEKELKKRIESVHAIGIRSKTQVTEEVLKCAHNLLVIGCFCIGTNQVDLECAARYGISVFNSPFSNSRSVAEMVIANIINLSRQMGDRSSEVHKGVWNKVSKGCFEIRGKKLGIVGYGHIGSQLSVLAESMGMDVHFYDVVQIMPLGCATPHTSLQSLLKTCDFITLHVPGLPETANLIKEKEISLMKKGSFLINASRGNVVDIDALSQALKSGHLAGCAVDVYPVEPASNGEGFISQLQGCPNTILTPHIGGSTEEAQSAIGLEVSGYVVKYINDGVTLGAVNFPENDLRILASESKACRVLNVHKNVPGVLQQVNKILDKFNIEKQICDSKGSIGYLMADVCHNNEDDLKLIFEQLNSINENIVTRILY